MGEFLNIYDLPKLYQEDLNNLNKFIMRLE
jgi:hypothetical protein